VLSSSLIVCGPRYNCIISIFHSFLSVCSSILTFEFGFLQTPHRRLRQISATQPLIIKNSNTFSTPNLPPCACKDYTLNN
jgi:hypothetical protein